MTDLTHPAVSSERAALYDEIGGMEFFERLVAGFYRRVADDPVLLPLYPDAPDLGPAARRLTLFLAQYWGGPGTYSEERGHPRLRQRHFPFRIGTEERDHWLSAMRASMDEAGVPAAVRAKLDAYFTASAEAMRNDP